MLTWLDSWSQCCWFPTLTLWCTVRIFTKGHHNNHEGRWRKEMKKEDEERLVQNSHRRNSFTTRLLLHKTTVKVNENIPLTLVNVLLDKWTMICKLKYWYLVIAHALDKLIQKSKEYLPVWVLSTNYGLSLRKEEPLYDEDQVTGETIILIKRQFDLAFETLNKLPQKCTSKKENWTPK